MEKINTHMEQTHKKITEIKRIQEEKDNEDCLALARAEEEKQKAAKIKNDAKEEVEKNIDVVIRLHGMFLWIGRPYICKKRERLSKKSILQG